MRLPFDPTRLCAAALAAAAAGVSLAQGALPEPQQARTERSYQGSYSASVSRELFTACDADSDDRLDVFEAAQSFEAVRTPRDCEDFAKLDRDRDGYVTWPEFDQLFREGLQNGGTFRVATARPFVMPVAPPAPPTPLRQFLRTHDADGDGSLSPQEIEQLLQRTGLPDVMAGPLKALDVDRNGKVDEPELAPWFEMLPPMAKQAAGGVGALPPPWFEADKNRDSRIDAAEFEPVLRRIDPLLARWAKALLARIDRDKDGKLAANELQPPPAEAPPKPAAPKPVPPPAR
ncbi:MAG: EF-hand domain-containing protein [Planctomycetes bacterium]|nr:EF-hand domain-containing protein [Planctomycetota bacterium]